MITVDIQTLAAIASIVAVGLAVVGILSRRIDRLETGLSARIEQGDAGLGARIDKLETGLSARIEQGDAGLGARIDKLETRLGSEIADCRSELRAEMRAGFAAVDQRFIEVDQRLMTLEQRTYDLSTRLPPAPASAGSQ